MGIIIIMCWGRLTPPPQEMRAVEPAFPGPSVFLWIGALAHIYHNSNYKASCLIILIMVKQKTKFFKKFLIKKSIK